MKNTKKISSNSARRSKSSSPELKGMSMPEVPRVDLHFSSSAFQNSPDPSSLPIPVFDEEGMAICSLFPVEYASSTTLAHSPHSVPSEVSKTERLRQFLNLRPQSAI